MCLRPGVAMLLLERREERKEGRKEGGLLVRSMKKLAASCTQIPLHVGWVLLAKCQAEVNAAAKRDFMGG
eukprot:scaffold155808_cov18-Tisochrysis_lutea.AAC.1